MPKYMKLATNTLKTAKPRKNGMGYKRQPAANIKTGKKLFGFKLAF